MPLVIGTGCSLGAVTVAYLAAARAGLADPDAGLSNQRPRGSANGGAASAKFEAVVAAHAHFAVAGELAADGAKGPGSYSVNFLDALHTVDGDRLAQARSASTRSPRRRRPGMTAGSAHIADNRHRPP